MLYITGVAHMYYRCGTTGHVVIFVQHVLLLFGLYSWNWNYHSTNHANGNWNVHIWYLCDNPQHNNNIRNGSLLILHHCVAEKIKLQLRSFLELSSFKLSRYGHWTYHWTTHILKVASLHLKVRSLPLNHSHP